MLLFEPPLKISIPQLLKDRGVWAALGIAVMLNTSE